MVCPTCGSKMKKEPCTTIGPDYFTRVQSATLHYCEECGCQVQTSKGVKGQTLFEGVPPVDQFFKQN